MEGLLQGKASSAATHADPASVKYGTDAPAAVKGRVTCMLNVDFFLFFEMTVIGGLSCTRGGALTKGMTPSRTPAVPLVRAWQ